MGGSSAGRILGEPRRTRGSTPRTTSPQPPQPEQHRLLHLQGTAGNQAVARLLQGSAAPTAMPTRESPFGKPPEPTTQRLMEASLGQDFSGVRVHTGQAAAQSARRVGARAFTVGADIVLAADDASSQASKLLLAHELAHVAQQRRGGGAPGPAHEAEAAGAATAVAAGRTPVVTLGAARGSIQREEPVSGAPAPPSWLDGVPARHVEGNIWEVDFRVGGPHYVGPYDELTAFVKKTGLKADAHHIVGGEHLEDLGSSFTYEKAPAVALDPGLHEKVITPRIGAEQRMVGGRRGGRPSLSAAEVASMYRSVYSEQAPFPELARIARNITRQSTTPPSVPPARKTPSAKPTSPPASKTQTASQVKASQASTPATPKAREDVTVKAGETATKLETPAVPAARTPEPSGKTPSVPPAGSTGKVASAGTRGKVEPSSGEPLAKVNLSDYPPDREGPIVGRFKDGKAISTITTAVTTITTAVSIGTNKDISALGLVTWHFDTTISEASKELESKYPTTKALWDKAGLDPLAKDYDLAVKKLNTPSNLLAAELIMAAFLPEEKIEAAVQAAHQRFAHAGGGQGNWQNYLNAADAYMNAVFDLQQELGDSPWILPEIADDINRRGSTLTRTGNDLEQSFFDLATGPLGTNPITYYPLFDLYHVAGVLQELGRRLEGLGSEISARASAYQSLWDQLDASLKKISNTTEILARKYHLRRP